MVRTRSGALKERAPSLVLCAALVLTAGCDVHEAQQAWSGPRTAAEASGFARTSTSAEVEQFVAACVAHSPLLRTADDRESTREEARPSCSWPTRRSRRSRRRAERPRLAVLVMANIHAGEVEGKEAVQILLREFAQGAAPRRARARSCVAFVPNYNPDGNDAIDRKNRPDQNGPVEGVGQRPNGPGARPQPRLRQGRGARDRGAAPRGPRARRRARDGPPHDRRHLPRLRPDLRRPDASRDAIPQLLEFARETFLPALRAHAERGFETFDYGDSSTRRPPGEAAGSRSRRKPRFGNQLLRARQPAHAPLGGLQPRPVREADHARPTP